MAVAGAGAAATRVAGVAATTKDIASAVPSGRKVRFKRGHSQAQRPVITAMTVIVGIGFAHSWIVGKKPYPGREYLVRMAVLGFVLALLAETVPKISKSFAYLIMTAVIFDRSTDIIDNLRSIEQPENDTPSSSFSPGGGLTLAAASESQSGAPVSFYQRGTPLTSEPVLPARQRVKTPRKGAQNRSERFV